MSLYTKTEGMTSGACSTWGQHVAIISTDCAVCVGVEFDILVSVIVDKKDVLA